MLKNNSLVRGFDLNLKKLIVPGIIMLDFLTLGTVLWRSSGQIMPLFFFGYIGASVGVGLGLYAALPKKKKPLGRRLSLLMVGTFLVGFAAIYGQENMQIEGAFFGLLSGIYQAAVIHYLIAKIFGPLLFGRIWSGWACWTVMILDLLPFKRNKSGRLPRKWEYLRYVHFALSLGLVLVLWYGFDQHVHSPVFAPLVWMLSGTMLYYIIGIALAYALKDNRAFCKYVCPIPVLQRIPSRFSMRYLPSFCLALSTLGLRMMGRSGWPAL